MRPKHKLAKTTVKWRMVGGGSLGLISFLVLMLLLPSCQSASADTNNPSVNDTFSASLATNVSTYVRSSIAIGLTKTVEMAVTPQAEGAFSTSEAKLNVTTNNVTGYKVYLTTTDGTSKLNPTNPKVETAIQPVEGIMTSENYKDGHLDTWGYSISDTDIASNEYQAVPQAGAAPVISTDQTSSDDSYILGFAVATSVDLPAGLYTNSVLASAVANPIEVRSLLDITYMQEMTPEICQVSFENETKQLIDSRDNKSYWVAKLRDGNCWMTQNLALDITEAGLKASDTDIVEDWDQDSAYPPVETETSYVAGAETPVDTAVRSWNVGTYALAVPMNSKASGSAHRPTVAVFDSQGVIEVGDWQPTYMAQKGLYVLSDTNTYEGLVAVDTADKTYDAHYLMGNYYTFAAATAGSGATLNDADAAGSICPKGWRLPIDSARKNSAREIYNLLTAYGLATGSQTGVAGVSYDDVLAGRGYNIAAAPLYFARAGRISSEINYHFGYVGVRGMLWTSSGSTNTPEKSLAFYISEMGSSGNEGLSISALERWYAASVRCLAR